MDSASRPSSSMSNSSVKNLNGQSPIRQDFQARKILVSQQYNDISINPISDSLTKQNSYNQSHNSKKTQPNKNQANQHNIQAKKNHNSQINQTHSSQPFVNKTLKPNHPNTTQTNQSYNNNVNQSHDSQANQSCNTQNYQFCSNQSIKLENNQTKQSHTSQSTNIAMATEPSITQANQPHTSQTMEQPKISQQHINNVQQDVPEDVSVLGILKCHNCHEWMASDDVTCCNCKIVCKECATFSSNCTECKEKFTFEFKVSLLHAWVAFVIHHPCKFKGCPYVVGPKDNHETSCLYKPFKCFKCEQDIPTVDIKKHFANNHPKQIILTETTRDVKPSDFWIHPLTNKEIILCYIQGQIIWIMLNKSDGESDIQFIINPLHIDENNVNTTIKFDFKFKNYVCTRNSHINKSQSSNNPGLLYVDVPKDVVDDWKRGECILDVIVVVRQKRKFNRSTDKKKKMKKVDQQT